MRHRIRKAATQVYDEAIAKAEDRVTEMELKMRKEIEQQLYMNRPPQNLINYYTEGMVQFGYLAMFANSLPLAPLFSFLTNLLEIKIKLDNM